MADEEELKAMILTFRVSELHMLLGFAGRNKTGRKSELQARAIELLQLGSYPVILKIKNLYKSIQQATSTGNVQEAESTQSDMSIYEANCTRTGVGNGPNLRPSRSYVPQYGQGVGQEATAEVYNSTIFQHTYALKTNSQIHTTHYPVHPDVKLKKLPFYEIAAELLKPSSLVPQVSAKTQENTFVFHLTPQQATAIGLSRHLRTGCKADYSVQGQLRFCLLETTSEQDDCFPPGIMVKVNNKICHLPNAIPTTKPGVEPKRPPRPINITNLMKISPTVGNTVQVQWTPDYNRGYVVAVYLVHKKTSEDLLNRLKAKGVRAADYTRGMKIPKVSPTYHLLASSLELRCPLMIPAVKDKLNEDADSEIATTSLRVSLICPLGKMRLVTPCRASTCEHLQCFDASLYIQMNERKPTWLCPVCDKPALYDKLVIDGYFQEVLSSGKLPPDRNEIQLHSDGSWSSHVGKKEVARLVEQSESNHVVKLEEQVETVQVETIDLKTVAKDQSLSSPKKDASEKRKVEEVDLTVSDSDDEPLIIHKRRDDPYFQDFKKCKGNPSPNAPESVISSGKDSPSIIVLDSDSSSSISIPPTSPPPNLSPILESHPTGELICETEGVLPPGAETTYFPCQSTTDFSEVVPEL